MTRPSTDLVLDVKQLTKTFQDRGRLRDLGRKSELVAVDQVSLEIQRGAAMGLVGESGSGKSTFARCLVGLIEPTSGTIQVDGRTMPAARSIADRQRIQMIFQNPFASLNPRMTVRRSITEVLRTGVSPPSTWESRCRELMNLVGLPDRMLDAYPRQMSGGQCQRVCIARALANRPEVIVADEPVSALDVSVQALILNLIIELRQQLDLTLLLISHDLSIVRYVADSVAVMYLGRIVETASTQVLFTDPRHPYTRGLLEAVPRLHARPRGERAALTGDPPSPYLIPDGCRFRARCRYAEGICAHTEPMLTPDPLDATRDAACHFAFNQNRAE